MSLFEEANPPQKQKKHLSDSAEGPIMVSDSSHIKRILAEALGDLVATPAEVQEWTGNRSRVNEEGPWIVEKIVGAKLTERRFRLMAESALDPKQHGTFINSLTQRQYNGVWRIASFEVADGTTVRMDGERRSGGRVGESGDDLTFVGSNVHSEPAPQTKATVRWVVRWVDSSGNKDVRYDIHGREIQPLTVEGLSQSGSTSDQVLGKLADAVDKLAATASPEPPPTAVAAAVERARTQK